MECLNMDYSKLIDGQKVSKGAKKEQWEIKNDIDADWWIEVKGEELAEARRLKMQIENKINFYKEKLDKVKKEEDFIIEKRNEKLAKYFETIDAKDMKKTKTMMKYRLPSGELIKKFPNPQLKKNNDKLVQWLESNNMDEYIETKKQAKWGDFKEKTRVTNGQVIVKDTGEIIEGVKVIERAPEFTVEV